MIWCAKYSLSFQASVQCPTEKCPGGPRTSANAGHSQTEGGTHHSVCQTDGGTRLHHSCVELRHLLEARSFLASVQRPAETFPGGARTRGKAKRRAANMILCAK